MAKKGSALSSLIRRVEAWQNQRHELANELRALADRMADGESPFPWMPATPGEVAAKLPSAKRRGRGRPKFTAAQRRAQSLAMKKSWAERAKKKSAGGKKG